MHRQRCRRRGHHRRRVPNPAPGAVSVAGLHVHAGCCIISRWSTSGSSGRPGSPAPSCCGCARSTPTSTCGWPPATPRPARRWRTCTRASGRPTPDLTFTSYDAAAVDGLDLVFLGLPHGASQAIVPELAGQGRPPRRPGGRLPAPGPGPLPAVVRRGAHGAPELLPDFAYGLPELFRRRDPRRRPRRHARLLPDGRGAGAGAARARRAGRSPTGSSWTPRPACPARVGPPKPNTTFCTVDEDFTAYGLLDHRHTPEMEQVLGASVLFTPHLAPMNRGILATCYARPTGRRPPPTRCSTACGSAYADEPFVVVTDGSPSTKATLGSNCAHVTARLRRAHRLGGGDRRHRQPHQGRVGCRGAVRQPPPRPPRGHRPPHRGRVPVSGRRRDGSGRVHRARASRAGSSRRAIPT